MTYPLINSQSEETIKCDRCNDYRSL